LIVIAVLAFGIGVVAGVAVAVMTWRVIVGPAEVGPSLLRIQAPAGAVIRVNEALVSEELVVTAGAEQRVQITLPGPEVWEHTVVVPAGTTHELMLTSRSTPAEPR
jgi:hypothetical protein